MAFPKLSVCIATHNGEKYLLEQLESIRSQLSEHDEIVISDDSSTDRTVKIIKRLNDSRIKLYEDNFFRSPIYNFENSISHATGEIIFMSDQDDLWLPQKVATVCEVFRDKPLISLVATDAKIINERGEIILETLYSGKAGFTSKVLPTIVKNRFVGCTLAFRRSILPVLLPFPENLPMHDSWIGIMNQLYGGVHFIDTPLIAYRRHSENFSSSTHAGWRQMTTWRWNLVKAVTRRMLAHRTGKNAL